MQGEVYIPDGGWGWVIVACSFLIHMFVVGTLYALSVLYVAWLAHFDNGKGLTSWIISLAVAVMFGIGPVPGALARRWDNRTVVILGGLVMASGFLFSYFAMNVYFLVVTIGIIAGTGAGCCYLPSVSMVAMYFTSKRSVAMGIAASGLGAGAFFMAPFINWLVDFYGWRGCMLILSGISLNMCVLGSLMRPLNKAPRCRNCRWEVDEVDLISDNFSSTASRKSVTVGDCGSVADACASECEHEMCSGVVDVSESGGGGFMAGCRRPRTCVYSSLPKYEMDSGVSPVAYFPAHPAVISQHDGKHSRGHSPESGVKHSNEHSRHDKPDLNSDNLSCNLSAPDAASDVPLLGIRSRQMSPESERRSFGSQPDQFSQSNSSHLCNDSFTSPKNTLTSQSSHDTKGNHAFLQNRAVESLKVLESRVRRGSIDATTSSIKFDSNISKQKPYASQMELRDKNSIIFSSPGPNPEPAIVSSFNDLQVMLTGNIGSLMFLDKAFSPSMTSMCASKPSVLVGSHRMDQGSEAISDDGLDGPKNTWWRKFKAPMLTYIRLLQNGTFLVFSISNFFTNLSFFMPVLYMVDRAQDSGIQKGDAAMLVSVYGAGNIFGKLFFGWLADRGLVDRLFYYIACLTVCGVSTSLSPLCGSNHVLHSSYAFVFGCFIGAYVTLVPIVTVDLMGLSVVGESFGLLLCFMGVATAFGSPVAGWIFDATGSYTISFILHGLFIVFSALMLLPLLVMKRRQRDGAAVPVVEVEETT
ncbi:uncharacterized protein LOC101852192 [Aplysia californica]|uniref:Uncharacterized protein LOC101852192 n=1 Tax=Aplysia californica TaxID=6500 RepID=A0ABM0JWD2_APLCA|nr:uncharacterized protein LOC101852192 [Aplysia californica]